MAKYKLIYFDGRGLGESIRQILSYAGQDFVDERIPTGGLTLERKAEFGLEYGQLPVLEIDGKKKLSQSFAICRYLAKKYNLVGKNDEEENKCDELVEAVREFNQNISPLTGALAANDSAKVAALTKTVVDVDGPTHLKRFENYLQKGNRIFLVGDSITYADIIFTHTVTNAEMILDVSLTKKFPAVAKLIATVQSEPKIKAWLDTRPKGQKWVNP